MRSEPDDRTPATGIVLAPMEGAIDVHMRAELCAGRAYARCVTEFVRVCDVLLPPVVFHRLCPELAHGGTTPDGTPVYVQLLGSDPAILAVNAQRAARLGAAGIDLNFGCPAKTVNRSRGGSVLLDHPGLVGRIVAAVREAVPHRVPVTVKVRLGHENAEALPAVAAAVRSAGADELAVHARSRRDGYRPPAYWSTVAPVADAATRINGEIWSVADARRARAGSGCTALMIGRGALAAPDLAERIRDDSDASPLAWPEVCARVQDRFECSDARSDRHVGNRTKQWLVYLRRTYPEAGALFSRLRTLHDRPAFRQAFAEHRAAGHDREGTRDHIRKGIPDQASSRSVAEAAPASPAPGVQP